MDKGRLAESLLCFAFKKEKASAIVGDMLERTTSLWHFWASVGSVLFMRSWRWSLGWFLAWEVHALWYGFHNKLWELGMQPIIRRCSPYSAIGSKNLIHFIGIHHLDSACNLMCGFLLMISCVAICRYGWRCAIVRWGVFGAAIFGVASFMPLALVMGKMATIAVSLSFVLPLFFLGRRTCRRQIVGLTCCVLPIIAFYFILLRIQSLQSIFGSTTQYLSGSCFIGLMAGSILMMLVVESQIMERVRTTLFAEAG
jgi:hypothetical protein